LDGGLLLTVDMLLVLSLLGLTVILFIGDWFPADVAALLILVMLGLMGLVAPEQLFAGFSSNAVMSILAVMLLGAGLDRAGLLRYAAGLILWISQGTERRLILAFSALAGSLSGFMQNPAVTALFLPIAGRISSRTGHPLSQLLMPMAFCVILGGSMTMVGNSPMILLNDLLASANRNLPAGAESLQALPLFAVFPIGLGLLLAGLVYFAIWGWRRLPEHGVDQSVTPASVEAFYERLSGRRGELCELVIGESSPLVGIPLKEFESLAGAPLVLAMKTPVGEARIAPPGDTPLEADTLLGVLGDPELVVEFAEMHQLTRRERSRSFRELLDPERAGISEAVIPLQSPFVGKTLDELRLRRRLGISPLMVTRGTDIYTDDARGLRLRPGDALVIHSSWRDLAEYRDREFVVITDFPKQEARPQKLPHAILFFFLPFVLALTVEVPLAVALMSGAVGMLVSGVLKVDEAYKAISWRTIFALAAMIPLGASMESTGAAAWLAQEIVHGVGRWPEVLLQLLVGLIAAILTMLISQIGATVVVVPMAINIALAANHNPLEYALIAALGASNNLITASNPVIAMVAGPAGYSTRDLARVGLPLMLVYLVLSLILVRTVF
jgi:di/tricarboxylate transporter